MEYEILKDFKGSQDGRFAEDFKAGTTAELSDYLVACLPDDCIKKVGPLIDNKAITTDGTKPQRKARTK